MAAAKRRVLTDDMMRLLHLDLPCLTHGSAERSCYSTRECSRRHRVLSSCRRHNPHAGSDELARCLWVGHRRRLTVRKLSFAVMGCALAGRAAACRQASAKNARFVVDYAGCEAAARQGKLEDASERARPAACR